VAGHEFAARRGGDTRPGSWPGIAAGGEIQQGPAAKNLGRRRAAGIYGAIITAAIFDTAGGHLSTAALVISVVVTLLVYWLAEEYAEVLGERVEGGRLPSRAGAGDDCAQGFRPDPPALKTGPGRTRVVTPISI
jgi:hypothetical protein